MNPGQELFDYVCKHKLVHIGSNHALCVVVRRQQVLHHRHQQEERVLLVHKNQHHTRYKIEGLTIPDVRVVECKSLQHTAQ
jgi:hypothetical protein